jgi:hypothetical protein
MRNKFFINDEIIIFREFNKNIENKGFIRLFSLLVKVFDEFIKTVKRVFNVLYS